MNENLKINQKKSLNKPFNVLKWPPRINNSASAELVTLYPLIASQKIPQKANEKKRTRTLFQSFKGNKVPRLEKRPVSHRSETTWISHFELRNFSFHWNSRSWCWRICWLKSIGYRSLPLFHCFVNSNVIPISPLYCFFLFFQFFPSVFQY